MSTTIGTQATEGTPTTSKTPARAGTPATAETPEKIETPVTEGMSTAAERRLSQRLQPQQGSTSTAKGNKATALMTAAQERAGTSRDVTNSSAGKTGGNRMLTTVDTYETAGMPKTEGTLATSETPETLMSTERQQQQEF